LHNFNISYENIRVRESGDWLDQPFSLSIRMATIDDSERVVSTSELRSRLPVALRSALSESRNVIIDAPTSSGKSYLVATTRWRDFPEVTGDGPVIHFSTTKKARDEAAKKTVEAGLVPLVLEGREDACPVAAGDFDGKLPTVDGLPVSKWFRQKCDHEHIPFGKAHDYLLKELGGLPCCEGTDCPGRAQWSIALSSEVSEYDIVHATVTLAHVRKLVHGANVLFDERPNYEVNISQERVRRVINRLLRDGLDGEYMWESIVESVRAQTSTLREIQELVASLPTYRWSFDDRNVHVLAPDILLAVTNGKPTGGIGFAGWHGSIGVVLDAENTIRSVYQRPDLSAARCVIGLDAHPSPHLWRVHTGLEFEIKPILTADESRPWRRKERGLTVIQVGTHTRPLTKGWHSRGEKRQAKAIIEAVLAKHPSFRSCICPKQIRDDVEEMMKQAGIDEPLLMHYGMERSRNDFEGEDIGLVLGCIDPGDLHLLGIAGLLGFQAEQAMGEKDDGSVYRKPGRTFTGPDAGEVNQLLADIRDSAVAQAVGRWARDPRSGDTGAVVYVWTDALPVDLRDHVVSGVKGRPTEKKRQVLEVLRETSKPMTVRKIVNKIDISEKHTYSILDELVEQNIVGRSEGTGPYNANEYQYLDGSVGYSVDLYSKF
jgi:hypothetical protein